MTARLVAGLDIGSTEIKVLVTQEDGTELLIVQRPTPWRSGRGGATELDGGDLISAVVDLLQSATRKLIAHTGDSRVSVAAIGIAGMGETGYLVDQGGAVVAPGIAWFDPRGQDQVDALPADLGTEFGGRTGLPLGVQVSVTKLLYLRDSGTALNGCRWFNVPEFVATALGAKGISEYSLTSRTGLLDQDTGAPWARMLDYLGVDGDFLPPLTNAGTNLGIATARWLPAAFSGARVTVAGHDHLVSAVSRGAIPRDRYHVSMGTAEVLLRVLDEPLTFEARSRLTGWLINCVRHVTPGRHVLVAGVKTGLLLRRALQLTGVENGIGRDRLDEDAIALPVQGKIPEGGIDVRGARNNDGVLSIAIRADGVTPAEMFNAVLRHSNEEIRLLIDAMDQEIPPARSSLLTGGWAGMKSVQRARSAVLPHMVISGRVQDTAYGATRFAAALLHERESGNTGHDD
ncbi:MAG: FGGY family carbohydrate kinase [Microbacteriaceae bacterium]